MKTFEVQYTSRLGEEKMYSSEIISASTEIAALKNFSKLFNIKDYKQLLDNNFMWEDNSWWGKFKCINEIQETTCPHCNGKRIIPV